VKVGYLDCFSGLSGDMILGALVDSGLAITQLSAELEKLKLKGYQISSRPEKRGVITGTRFLVNLENAKPKQRRLDDVANLIVKSDLSNPVKERSVAIFKRLAEAEAKVHRTPVQEVQLHDTGAIDAIVDIVGTAIGLELLGIEHLYSSPLPSGSGTVECQHGIIPIPAPATLELIASSGAPIRPTPERDVELVTPTGAAIVTTLARFQKPTLMLEKVGYGIGSRETETIPNVLPLWVGELVQEERELLLLETNIDDMSPELCGYVMEQLFENGAADVWFTPIQMKKNRPGIMLSVLAKPESQTAIAQVILRETPTLGLRVQPVERHLAVRETARFESSLGKASIKIKRLEGKVAGLSPEYEDCRRLALEHDLPLQDVYRIVINEASSKFIERYTG
jgi:uncharacterized protein (TIGR00299 family) protein